MKFLSDEQAARLRKKKHLSIGITDSGLGGLAICADIVEGFKRFNAFEKITVTYYNAWPEENRGYNRIEDHDEKLKIFNRALEGMLPYEPDIILIACNTLSVIYHETRFSGETDIPVIDIVDFGVDLIHKDLTDNPGKNVLITGTVTTIESEEHKRRLVTRDIAPSRITGQACDQLATTIEKGPMSPGALALVEKYMLEASKKLPDTTADTAIALCCTHFGYSADALQKDLQSHIEGSVSILNPNRAMADFLVNLCGSDASGSEPSSDIDLKVVSRIPWNKEKISAISAIIEKTSPMTVKALKNYSFIPNLFPVD